MSLEADSLSGGEEFSAFYEITKSISVLCSQQTATGS
jgi:hypothetical protein